MRDQSDRSVILLGSISLAVALKVTNDFVSCSGDGFFIFAGLSGERFQNIENEPTVIRCHAYIQIVCDQFAPLRSSFLLSVLVYSFL